VGYQGYQEEIGKGVTGFFPAAVFATGDGPGQLIAQLAGIVAIGLVAFLVGWLVFLLLNLPYRPLRRSKVDSTSSGDDLGIPAGPESAG
jgi:ammonia channel protein AmtB